MKPHTTKTLNPALKTAAIDRLEASLHGKVVGQEAALAEISDVYQTFLAEMNAPNRPLGNFLFLGPTGTGKTRVVEALAETLFNNPLAVIKIDCGEFQGSHSIEKLVGSPPGYLGHDSTSPMFCQGNIDRHQTRDCKLTLLLFDEIEKANNSLWQLILGILDKATMTTGDNQRVDFSRCLIFMTSNLGAWELEKAQEGGFGFGSGVKQDVPDSLLDAIAIDAARRKFSPEFMNRLDKVVVFQSLRDAQLRRILDLELRAVQQRILQAETNQQFTFECSTEVKDLLLAEGTDLRYGARHLKRVIEKRVTQPLTRLLCSGQVNLGDTIYLDRAAGGEITFTKQVEVKRILPLQVRTVAVNQEASL